MHDLYAPEPLAELGATLARAVRVFLMTLLVAGTIAAALALLLGVGRVDHVATGWAMLAGFAMAGVRAYRPPSS